MSRGFDLGKLFGGPDQGDGPIGLLLNPLAGLAILGGGAALAGSGDVGVDGAAAGVFTDVGGAAARGGAGIFARIFEMAGSTDWLLDYILYRDFTGKGGFGGFAGMGAGAKQHLENVTDIVTAHSFMRAQLEIHKDKPGVAALRDEYRELGLNLPSADMATRVYKKLSMLLHPDKFVKEDERKAAEALFKVLGTSKEDLIEDKTRIQRDAYNSELRYNEASIKQAFEKSIESFTKVNWKEFSEKASQAASHGPKLALAGPATATGIAGAAAKAGSWFSKQSSAKQTGIVFAGGAVAALGVYAIANKIETRRKEHNAALTEPPASHTERLAQHTAANAARTPSP